MKLVIAEKPSVAQSLAAVIGATARKDGYLEGGGWRVSWCVGHLAGLADADAYNPDYAKWRYDDLPILPEPWQMVVSKDKKKQFDVLKQLMNAPDVTEVVNACDAGREGELIFRSVYELAGCQKPMKRLWISSMEDSAIREGFANLRPGADYDGLRDAALCRAKLAGGYQCHPAVFRAVPPDPQHRTCHVPDAGPHCPARSRDRHLQAGAILHGHTGAARFHRFRGAHGRQGCRPTAENGLPRCGCHSEKSGAQKQIREAARPL